MLEASFQIGACTWNCVHNDKVSQDVNEYSYIDWNRQTVFLGSTDQHNRKVSESRVKQSILHSWIAIILNGMEDTYIGYSTAEIIIPFSRSILHVLETLSLKLKPTITGSFDLGPSKWKIEQDNEYLQRIGALGVCCSGTDIIKLSSKHNGEDIYHERIEQTMYHELTHAILFSIGQNALSADEHFVNLFGIFLNQFRRTVTYTKIKT
jgi:hypothetical protein